jgi:transcriptional regulator with XRE-family HTH domain
MVTYALDGSNVTSKENCGNPHAPRSKGKKKPLRGVAAVLGATGLKQTAFAAEIGVKRSMVDSWLRGKSKLDANQKLRIAAYTGALPWTLDGRPRDFANRVYTTESWEEWQKRGVTAEQIEELRQLSHEALTFVLEATAQNNQGDATDPVFRSFLVQFDAFLHQQIAERGLGQRIQHVVMDATIERSEGVTAVGHIRAQLGKHPDWKTADRTKWTAETEARWKEKRYRLFQPFIGFAKVRGRGLFLNGHRTFRQEFDFEIDGRKISLVVNSIEPHSRLQQGDFELTQGSHATFFPPPSF